MYEYHLHCCVKSFSIGNSLYDKGLQGIMVVAFIASKSWTSFYFLISFSYFFYHDSLQARLRGNSLFPSFAVMCFVSWYWMRYGQYKNLFLSFRHLLYSACNLGPFWTILQRIYIELRSDSKFSDVRIRPHFRTFAVECLHIRCVLGNIGPYSHRCTLGL